MSATQTAAQEAMDFEAVNDLLYEAMLSYEKTLKSGIQLQEHSVKLWRDLLAEVDASDLLRAKLEAVSEDLFPALRERLEEIVESSSLSLMLVNRAGNQTFNLLGKSLEICRSTSITEFRNRINDLLESYLALVHENVPILLSTNHKIVHVWQGLVEWNPVHILCASATRHETTRVA